MLRRPPRTPHFPYTTLFRSFTRAGAIEQAQLDLFGMRRKNREIDPLAVPARPERIWPPRPHLLRPGHQRSLIGLRRSEEHTSELQSQFHLVCRLLLEKKKIT